MSARDVDRLRDIVDRLKAMQDQHILRLREQSTYPPDEVIDMHTGMPVLLPYLTALATAYSALIPEPVSDRCAGVQTFKNGPRCLHQATWSPGGKSEPIAFVCSQELGHDGKHGYADLRWDDDGDMSALNLPPSQFQTDRA